VPTELADKAAALTLVRELNQIVMAEVLRNEELIESLRQSNPEADKDLPKDKFSVSKSTKSTCIEFLEENDVEISSWIGEANENEQVKKILKVWFTLIRGYNSRPWCSFPEILDNDEFYANAKIVLLTEATMLGKQSHLS
jgi:hypothetical protein